MLERKIIEREISGLDRLREHHSQDTVIVQLCAELRPLLVEALKKLPAPAKQVDALPVPSFSKLFGRSPVNLDERILSHLLELKRTGKHGLRRDEFMQIFQLPTDQVGDHLHGVVDSMLKTASNNTLAIQSKVFRKKGVTYFIRSRKNRRRPVESVIS